MDKARRQAVRRYANGMLSVARAWVVATIMLLPFSTFAQDAFYVQGRLDGLQRQISELAVRIEKLKAEDQELQRQLESMQTKFEARLERLEKGGASSKKRLR
jgi:TolA-binding protein